MVLKTAICDDEKSGIDRICKLLEYYHFDTGTEFDKSIFTDPDALINSFKTPGTYDLVFLDVEMSVNGISKNGIETAKLIRAIPDRNVRIVYISNYPSYMQMSFNVQASQYLGKDVSNEYFHTVMDNIIQDMTRDSALIRIKTGPDQWNLLRVQDIICVKSFFGQRDTVAFCTPSQQFTETGRSILTVSEILKEQHFIFANKYCLVNMRHVVQFTHDKLILSNTECIEISRHFRKPFVEQFSNNILTI